MVFRVSYGEQYHATKEVVRMPDSLAALLALPEKKKQRRELTANTSSGGAISRVVSHVKIYCAAKRYFAIACSPRPSNSISISSSDRPFVSGRKKAAVMK